MNSNKIERLPGRIVGGIVGAGSKFVNNVYRNIGNNLGVTDVMKKEKQKIEKNKRN